MENFKEELATFDQDLKNYAPQVFREIKQFITNKQTFATQEVSEFCLTQDLIVLQLIR